MLRKQTLINIICLANCLLDCLLDYKITTFYKLLNSNNNLNIRFHYLTDPFIEHI